MRDRRATRLEQAAALADLVFLVVTVPSAYAAAFGWRPAAFLMLGALSLRLVAHITNGLAATVR
jgi:hypothetical protein